MLQVKRWKQSIEGKCWDGQKSGNIWASFSHPRCFLCSTHSDFPHLTSFMLWYFISWILIANIIECLSRMRHCAQPITYIFSWCHHVKLVFLSHFLRWENRGSEAMTGWLAWGHSSEPVRPVLGPPWHLVSKSHALFTAQIPSTATLWGRYCSFC